LTSLVWSNQCRKCGWSSTRCVAASWIVAAGATRHSSRSVVEGLLLRWREICRNTRGTLTTRRGSSNKIQELGLVIFEVRLGTYFVAAKLLLRITRSSDTSSSICNEKTTHIKQRVVLLILLKKVKVEAVTVPRTSFLQSLCGRG